MALFRHKAAAQANGLDNCPTKCFEPQWGRVETVVGLLSAPVRFVGVHDARSNRFSFIRAAPLAAASGIQLPVRSGYADDMSETSPDPASSESHGSEGIFSSSRSIVAAVAAAGFLLVGACVLCGGGLALPVVLRNQRQREADEAQRSAVEALKRAGQEMHQNSAKDMQMEQEAVQKLAEQEDIQQRNILPNSGNNYDNSTERTEPK